MFTKTVLYALAVATAANAHGRLDRIVGNAGGNSSGLGIKGAVIPGAGPNYMTEPDTTTFWSHTFATDDDNGFTDGSQGNLSPQRNLAESMALSGDTLAQVTPGGYLMGNWHTITDDGCGPLQAAVEPSANSKWSTATAVEIFTDMPGDHGECTQLDSGDDQTAGAENETIASRPMKFLRRALQTKRSLQKRAKNVNKSFGFSVKLPSDLSCTGSVNGINNLCQVKISNNSPNGPFGGTFLIQQSNNGTANKMVRSVDFSA